MSIEQVYIVLGRLGGFVSIHKTVDAANESIVNVNARLSTFDEEDQKKYKDEFEIVEYNIYNVSDTVANNDVVYVMLTLGTELPLLVTRDKEEFERKQNQMLKLLVTYPEPSSFWSHSL
jgi:hypothetical protein